MERLQPQYQGTGAKDDADNVELDHASGDLTMGQYSNQRKTSKDAELLKRAVGDPDARDRALTDALSDTLYEERRLVQMIRVQIEDQPTRMPTICQWYDSALRASHQRMSQLYRTAFSFTKNMFPRESVMRIYGTDCHECADQSEITLYWRVNDVAYRRFDT